MIHIGNLLVAYFEQKRTRRAALARKMQVQLATVLSFEKKQSLQTARLYELCTHLQHNFFMDIAQTLPATFTTNKDIFEEKDQEIARLKKEVEKLTIERDVLLKIKT